MFSSSSLRALALSAAILSPALYLTGCGGGGSGPSSPTSPMSTPLPTGAPTPTPVPMNPPGGGQLLFDDFSSAALNSSVWDRYKFPQKLQRTGFGNNGINLNENGTSFTRLTLDSYNADAPGDLFRGTEIITKNSYRVGNGLEAEARVRAPNLPSGLIAAFFLISDRYISGGGSLESRYRKDEIDFEFITKQQEEFGGRNRLYTNVWNNWNEELYGFDGNPNAEDTPNRNNDDLVYMPSVDSAYDYANWNIYKIRWLPDRTEFYINDKLERIEREVKPDQALSLHFNFWTPTPDFQQAFSNNLPGPVSTANNPDRRTYQFDVDYVKVTALGAGANAARVAVGDEAAKELPVGAKSYRTMGR